MNKKDAEIILGTHRAKWELRQIISALSRLELLNNYEDGKRLKAARFLLTSERGCC